MIYVSIGTAGVLGLCQVPMLVAPTTAYLMLGGRCAMNCGFCAQARDSQASDLALSRVTWPEFPLEEVCARLQDAERQGSIRRCCIQVTAGQGYWARTVEAVRAIRAVTRLPLNVAILPANRAQVSELIELGVERIGFGLDAACERVFLALKGSHWERMLVLLQETARQFPGRTAVHLIVGLGETERELVERVFWAHERGIGVGLFAFTPIAGTRLEGQPQPMLGQYRRMQAACRLILHHGARMADFSFGDRDGQRDSLVGLACADWRTNLADGEAFRTLGCPGCNRPFYNERPGGAMYNYPRPLTPEEARRAVDEMEIAD